MKFHLYNITVNKKYIYRILNKSENIKIRNVKFSEENVSFVIEKQDIDKVNNLLGKENISPVAITESGVYTYLTSIPIIKTTLCIIIIFIAILFVNSLFIWNIHVDGNYSYSGEQISNFVRKQNIKEGCFKNGINCNNLEKEIRKKYDDISWVCAEVKGTSLLIHIKENYITEISQKEEEPYDLVSGKSAKIVSMLVRKGVSKVKVGDIVSKETVLVSGAVDVLDEAGTKLFYNFCNADGDIIGETNYKYIDELNENYTYPLITDNKTLLLPGIASYKWNIKHDKKTEHIIVNDVPLKFLGNIYLPISIQKYTIIQYETKKAVYTKNQAETILKDRLTNKLSVLEQKGYKIIEKNVKIEKVNDTYHMEGTIVCHEPLGKVSYINVKEFEEEITTVNEYN